MSTLQPLVADAVVGTDVRDCLLLASHPAERMLPNGWQPSPTRRTLVLRFDGSNASFAMTLPDPLVRAWTADSGTGYATPVLGHYIYVYTHGAWKRERFSEKDEDIFNVWGLSGTDGSSDTVFLSTGSGLFIRRSGQWVLQLPPRPAKRVYGVHGMAPDQIYVCSDQGLLLWNGLSLEETEGPEGPLAKRIAVLPNELIGGGDVLTHWTPALGWQEFSPVVSDVTALLPMPGHLFVGRFESGICERVGNAFSPVTPEFECWALHGLGSSAIALGDLNGFVFIDNAWHPLTLPPCEVGQIPP